MAISIPWTYPVRGVQAVLSIVVLGLMAYVVQWWTSHWMQSPPTPMSFLVFAPVWSLAALIALVVVQFKFTHLTASPAGRYGLLALEGTTMLFWFAGFVALAVFLADRICFGQVCDVARAGTVIGGLSWAVWMGSFVMGVWEMVKGGKVEKPVAKEVEMQEGA